MNQVQFVANLAHFWLCPVCGNSRTSKAHRNRKPDCGSVAKRIGAAARAGARQVKVLSRNYDKSLPSWNEKTGRRR